MKYIHKLKEFKGANGNIKSLKDKFEDIANYFLTKGHFLVNDQRKIYICDVEFYYHEEEGDIKDWIMYHRNNHKGNGKKLKYYKTGQFNAHASGIDITFEYEDKHDNKETDKSYRAGMLIRGFKFDKMPDDWTYSNNRPKEIDYDTRSTYFYEALLNDSSECEKFTIKWKEEENSNLKDYIIANKERINVFQFKDATNNKDTAEKCTRKWRFFLKKTQ